MTKLRIALVVLVAAVALAQAIPVEHTNPPVESTVQAPPAVLTALKKSCWDCHSNETVWGWHTRIAPMSWFVARDVKEGREELNFSRWDAIDAQRLQKLARKIPEEVADGEMPPLLYTLAHPSAKPTQAEKDAIVAWGRTLGGVPPRAFPGSRGAEPASGTAPDRHDGDEHEQHEQRR